MLLLLLLQLGTSTVAVVPVHYHAYTSCVVPLMNAHNLKQKKLAGHKEKPDIRQTPTSCIRV